MTNLENIQKESTEFNINFHMRNIIGKAIIASFMEENRKNIEGVIKSVSPAWASEITISHMFKDFVKAYLDTSFDGEEME